MPFMPQTSRGTLETILVVDDNDLVRQSVIMLLERAGFVVLSADGPDAAIRIAGKEGQKIDLLLTDVEMPSLSGPDLGELLKETRPKLHIMLMSGGADGNLLVLNYGWAYIQKPFVAVKLVEMVNEVLHSPDRSQPGGHRFDSRRDRGRSED